MGPFRVGQTLCTSGSSSTQSIGERLVRKRVHVPWPTHRFCVLTRLPLISGRKTRWLVQKSRDHPHPRRDSCSRLDVAQPAQSGEATHLSDISMDPLAAAREQVAQLSAGGGAAPPRSDTDCHFFLLGSCRNVRTPPLVSLPTLYPTNS